MLKADTIILDEDISSCKLSSQENALGDLCEIEWKSCFSNCNKVLPSYILINLHVTSFYQWLTTNMIETAFVENRTIKLWNWSRMLASFRSKVWQLWQLLFWLNDQKQSKSNLQLSIDTHYGKSDRRLKVWNFRIVIYE